MNTLFIPYLSEYNGMKCVYKLTFDGNYFYIGSTKNLRKRLVVYNSIFSQNKILRQSKRILSISKIATYVVLEILYLDESISNVFKKENELLALVGENKYSLNRNRNAYSNKGIIWTEEEKLSISKKMKGIIRSDVTKNRRFNKIIKTDIEGNFLGSYKSYDDAASDSNCCRVTVANVVNGKKDSHNGFIFKYA